MNTPAPASKTSSPYAVIPKGSTEFTVTPGGCSYATELIELVREDGRFAIVGAAYPEGHTEAANREEDWKRLGQKFDLGASAAITQCIFETANYQDLCAFSAQSHPQHRICRVFSPLSTSRPLSAFCSFCGAKIPAALSDLLEPLIDKPAAMRAAGMAYTIQLCRDLLEQGAPGIHVYASTAQPQPLKLSLRCGNPDTFHHLKNAVAPHKLRCFFLA